MRKIIFFIITLFFLNTEKSIAQQSEFVSNVWYIENLILNGESHFLPQNEEVQTSRLWVDGDDSSFFYIDFCAEGAEGLGKGLTFLDNNHFSIYMLSVPYMPCEIEENEAFKIKYCNFIWNNYDFPFHYVITEEENNIKKLEITVNNSDKAIYYSSSLSAEKPKESDFTIYPNPTKDFIYVENIKSLQKLEVYNVLGEICLVKELNNTTQKIDVTNLSMGVYFFIFSNNNRIIKTEKIFKN